jgi:hypothetical protein
MRERMEAVHNDARCDGGGRFYRAHSKPDASRVGERCHVILRAHMNEPRDSCGPSTYGDDASQHLLAMAPRAKFGVRLKQGERTLAMPQPDFRQRTGFFHLIDQSQACRPAVALHAEHRIQKLIGLFVSAREALEHGDEVGRMKWQRVWLDHVAVLTRQKRLPHGE